MEEESNVVTINKELNIEGDKTENIRNLIYTIRGKQVMLDSDVAILERLTDIEYKLLEHDKKFDEVFNRLEKNKKEKFQK